MKKTWIKRLSLGLIFMTILVVTLGGCSKNKDVVLGDGKKEEEINKKQSLKVTEKNISIPEGYWMMSWKDDRELIIKNFENEELYSFNIESGEKKKISYNGTLADTTIYTTGKNGVNKDGSILEIKNSKLYFYNVNSGNEDELMDLKDVKKDVETKYKVENDSELKEKLSIGMVDGTTDKIYIITRAQYDGYHKNRIRIVDVNTKKVLMSDEYTDLYLTSVLANKEKFYVTSLFNAFYEVDGNKDHIDINMLTKRITVANSQVFMTEDGIAFKGWNFRDNDGEFRFYNVVDKKDEKSFYFQDREKLSSVTLANYNMKNNILVFTKSSKESNKENGHKETDFIGMVNGNSIETIYKISDYEEKGESRSWTNAMFNENGDKMILMRHILSDFKEDSPKKSRFEYKLIELKK